MAPTLLFVTFLALFSAFHAAPTGYLGCYLDNWESLRDLSFQADLPTNNVTIERCQDYCNTHGYSYAGLQFANQCFCGNKFGSYGLAAEADCNMPCTGNAQQLCGAGNRNSVYRTVGYVGCYIDSANGRDLSVPANLSTAVTVDVCKNYCGARGFRYSGVQFSRECFCGNSFGRYGASAESDCNMPCAGNDKEICGSGNRNSVYRTNYIGCNIDDFQSTRDLPVLANLPANQVTVDNCRNYCGARFYSYAGLQFANQCFCGNAFGRYGAAAETDCNTPCAGNSQEKCGAGNRNSVHVSANPGYMGCFADDGTVRDLSRRVSVSTTNTIESCKATCSSAGFLYAGMQFGQECWCGNVYGSYGQVANSECNVACSGDATELCGAGFRNSIYTTDIAYDPTVGNCAVGLVIDNFMVRSLPTLNANQLKAKYSNYWGDLIAYYLNYLKFRLPIAYIHVETSSSFSNNLDGNTVLNDFYACIRNGTFVGLPQNLCLYHLLTSRQPPGVGGLAYVASACLPDYWNVGLTVDGRGGESADLVVRRAIHEVGHSLGGNHPDAYTNKDPAYSCSVNDEIGSLRILRSVQEANPAAPVACPQVVMDEAVNTNNHAARAPSFLNYNFLNANARISQCATNAISSSLSSYSCAWVANSATPSVTLYKDINFAGESKVIEAHRGTGAGVCYNIRSRAASLRVTSFRAAGGFNISVYTSDDCRGAATTFTTPQVSFVGSDVNDKIESFKFVN